MQLTNRVRNEFYKCDVPDNTLDRIQNGLDRLGLAAQYSGVQASKGLYWGRVWIESLHLICEGKGKSSRLAKTSAYAELAERLSAGLYYPAFEEQVRFHLPALYEARTRDFLNYAWMDGYVQGHQDHIQGPLIRIEDLLSGQTHLRPDQVQEIKDSEMAGHWVDGYSLLQEQKVKVPMKFAAYIHGTNGIAAGNVLEEALVQAACEVFERHTQIRVVRGEDQVPSIDPESIEDESVHEMLAFYAANNVQVTLKDLSFGGLFPVLAAVYTNRNLPPDRLEYRTFIPGAAFHSREALSRCFTEGIQGKKSLQAVRAQLDQPVRPKSEVNSYYLLMKCGVSPTDVSFLDRGEMCQYREWKARDMAEELASIKDICRRLDTDCIVLDHTHPVIGFPVVRVIMPGISDFLPFLPGDVLTSERTKPSTAWKGEEYKRIAASFFHSGSGNAAG
ncbi:YcaO-like family protein [Desulfovermiculus halophilus]|jgi:YcaO-like protein with predicted kinase domain|uniref:YcaO-like family protein n=1 Tax=Desulfovermiculus halophilus TaxID=339722 RepID=UPI000480A2A7|nr:YcaO-like family protein [Desulfovermiculus halophilus]